MQAKVSKNTKKLIQTLGNIIKSHRENKNKSIYKISAECSISKSTWRDVEQAVSNNVSLVTLWHIAEGLDMPVWKLISELSEKLGEDFSLDENEF